MTTIFVEQRTSGAGSSVSVETTNGSVTDGSSLTLTHNLNDANLIIDAQYKDSNNKIHNISDFDCVKRAVNPTQFEAGTTTHIQGCKLSNGNFVIVYSDESDSSHGKFVIINPAGTIVDGPTTFMANNIDTCSVASLDYNEQFVIAYDNNNDSGKGYFSIYNNAGTSAVSATKFEDSNIYIARVAVMAKGTASEEFVVTCRNNSNNAVTYVYSAAGVLQHTVSGAISIYEGLNVTASSTQFIVAYQKTDNKGYITIYDSDATVAVAETEFTTGHNTGGTYYSIDLEIGGDDSTIMVVYRDTSYGSTPCARLLNFSGTMLSEPIDLNKDDDNACDWLSVNWFVADECFLVAYADTSNYDKLYLLFIDISGDIKRTLTFYGGGGTTNGEYPYAIAGDNGYFLTAFEDITHSSVGKYSIYRKLFMELEYIDADSSKVNNYSGATQSISMRAIK